MMDPILRRPNPWETADEVLRAPTPEEWRARQDEDQARYLNRWQALEAQVPSIEDMMYGFGPGAGMAIAGKIPLAAGALLFKDRPWMRDIVAKIAGKKWENKYSQERPGSLARTASEAVGDYEQTTGNPMATYGLEYEVRSPLKTSELQKKLPYNKWDVTGEAMGVHDWEPRYKHPSEIRTGQPLQNSEDIKRFLTKDIALLLDKEARQPLVAGGKHGGGLHIHQSSPEFQNPDVLKNLLKVYMEEEPYLFPPVPAYKQGPRHYVDPLAELFGSHRRVLEWDPMMTSKTAEEVFRKGPQKGPGLSYRSEYNRPRVEYRHQYTTNPLSRSGEDILVAQSLLDRAKQMPFQHETRKHFLNRLYEGVIKPGKEDILDIQRNKWFPKHGIHESYSPFTNHLLEKRHYTIGEGPRTRQTFREDLASFMPEDLEQAAALRHRGLPENQLDLSNYDVDSYMDSLLSSVRKGRIDPDKAETMLISRGRNPDETRHLIHDAYQFQIGSGRNPPMARMTGKMSNTIESLFDDLSGVQRLSGKYGRELGGQPPYSAWQNSSVPDFYFLSPEERPVAQSIWNRLRSGGENLPDILNEVNALNLPTYAREGVDDALIRARQAWINQHAER